MTDNSEAEAERPLDPATERLRRRMLRLLAVSVATMLLGVMAVLAAIVYKLNRDAAAPMQDVVPIALPADAAILGLALDGDTALLWLRATDRAVKPDGDTSLIRVDLRDGRIVSRHPLHVGAPADAPTASAPAAPPMLDLYRAR